MCVCVVVGWGGRVSVCKVVVGVCVSVCVEVVVGCVWGVVGGEGVFVWWWGVGGM